jgi:hypothetical protein
MVVGYTVFVAPVAQLDRASGYEPEGRVFESLRAHHLNVLFSIFDLLIAHADDCGNGGN